MDWDSLDQLLEVGHLPELCEMMEGLSIKLSSQNSLCLCMLYYISGLLKDIYGSYSVTYAFSAVTMLTISSTFLLFLILRRFLGSRLNNNIHLNLNR